jgi:5-methylcytosine-specific restriction endonuclease McrA
MGEPIPLELHHIDGNHNNNDLSNIQLLCPNCHAQTDNFSNKK